jgi:hypothetical protein
VKHTALDKRGPILNQYETVRGCGLFFWQNAEMTKWEYLVVIRENAGFYGGTLASLGEKGVKTTISPDLATSLNSLGNDGWELISHFESEFIFKRPKQ